MLAIDILREIGALAGYTVDNTTGADPANKTRALRRLNAVKADIISRYGGKWDSNYREGWLPLVPLYSTGTITVTASSNTVTGASTAWTTAFNGMKIMMPDGCYYKIASVISATSLVLTQPYQNTTKPGATYFIWQDEYRLYPDVLSIGGFVDYQWEAVLDEAWPRNMKQSYPVPATTELPTVYTVIGRKSMPTYSIGTISGTLNDNLLVGTSTAWLANVEPGAELVIGTVTYHVKEVYSDTSIQLYQYLKAAVVAGSTYVARAKNCVIVRFRQPTSQKVVHYWYWGKDHPAVNDNDEDWVMELYPEVILNGAVRKDYLDKNDVARASLSKQEYEDSIKNMKVANDSNMSGPRTLGYNIPPEARD